MSFVDGGFNVPNEALTDVGWEDEDTIWIGTDFGEGSITTSGYARIVKLWKRGTPLEDATTVFEGNSTDIFVVGVTEVAPDATYNLVVQYTTFQTQAYYLLVDDELLQLDLPADTSLLRFFKGRMIVSPQSEWALNGTAHAAGSVLAIGLESFLDGDRTFDVLFQPSERVAFDRFSSSNAEMDDYMIYTTLDNISSRMYRVTLDEDGNWVEEEIALPGLGSVGLGSNTEIGSSFFLTYSDFTTPTTLYEVKADGELEKVKASPSLFDADGVEVGQYEATSKDGTKIPYFIIKPDSYVGDGTSPTLLYGYGGFGISLEPSYDASSGSAWIEKGGVYVVANIRGGGEFGPEWHKAAQREKHQNNFDDFAAVAEDLIARNVTSPSKLGIQGGSQGGLLVGGTFVQRPELFGAVACQVPLLDMRRFHQLLRGASWVDEYGDPDSADWENFIKDWSPYHNVKEDEDYPKVLFTTSTNDDRVHPAHARKMAALMVELGHPVYFYEATEGGHGGGASLSQRAYEDALVYAFMWKQLGASPSSSVDMEAAETDMEISRMNPDLP